MGEAPQALDAYAVRLAGGNVLLCSSQALLDVLRSLELSLRLSRRDGHPMPARVQHLVRLLEAELAEASTAPPGTAALPQIPDLPRSTPLLDPIDTVEVATMLQLKPRQARTVAKARGGRVVAGRLLVERADIADEQRRRTEKRSA